MEGIIDTNVLVASLLEDDVNHGKARKILRELDSWYILTLVFHEFVWFLKETGLKVELVLPFLHHPKSEVVGINVEDIEFAVENTRKKPKKYNDFVILSVALRLKKPLVTFDTGLEREFTRRTRTQ